MPAWTAAWTVQRDYAVLGRYDEALEHLATEARGQLDWAWSDAMAEARNLPMYMQLLAQENLFEVWDELGPPPACRKTSDGYDCSVNNR